MSKNLLFFGMLFLGASLIISSIILSKSIIEGNKLNGVLNGSFTMNNSYNIDSDVLMPYEAGVILGYQQEDLIKDIKSGKLDGIPFSQVGGHYIFSKKALEEWVYSKTVN